MIPLVPLIKQRQDTGPITVYNTGMGLGTFWPILRNHLPGDTWPPPKHNLDHSSGEVKYMSGLFLMVFVNDRPILEEKSPLTLHLKRS